MFWMAAVMAAQALEKGKEARAQAKLDKFQMKQSVKMENKQREIDNLMSKTRGDLARFQQSNNNKYKLKAGGESVEAQRVNMLRLSDASVRGSFESRINAAEISGALAAQAGFAGIGGGSLSMLEATNKMRQGRAQELSDRQTDDQLYDGQRNIDQTVESTILGLDDVQYFDNINYMTAQESYIKQPSWAEIGMNAGMQFASTYASMGGFDGLGSKMPSWLGGKAAPSGSNAAGYSPQVLSKWNSGTTTQLR